jgi:hypothetical protein
MVMETTTEKEKEQHGKKGIRNEYQRENSRSFFSNVKPHYLRRGESFSHYQISHDSIREDISTSNHSLAKSVKMRYQQRGRVALAK